MADLGRWFKLWCSATGDNDLSCLTIADFGRWCKFGTYTKEHGTDGKVTISEPPAGIIHRLQSDFQVETFSAVLGALKRFPHVKISSVSSETNATVSFLVEWCNWQKYQGDFSSDRVRRHRAKIRENETPKKRRDEMRREENKNASSEAANLTQLLNESIAANVPTRNPPTPKQLESWTQEAERIHRIDKHDWPEIFTLLRFSQQDQFWKYNILSMKKFREKWNQLSGQMAKGSDHANRPHRSFLG